MNGTVEQDGSGWVVRHSDTLWSEPALVETVWRVEVLEDPYRRLSPGSSATYRGDGVWSGDGFRLGTNPEAESVQQTALRRPRGKRTWRNGEWV